MINKQDINDEKLTVHFRHNNVSSFVSLLRKENSSKQSQSRTARSHSSGVSFLNDLAFLNESVE